MSTTGQAEVSTVHIGARNWIQLLTRSLPLERILLPLLSVFLIVWPAFSQHCADEKTIRAQLDLRHAVETISRPAESELGQRSPVKPPGMRESPDAKVNCALK
jgi:hypothetical protein